MFCDTMCTTLNSGLLQCFGLYFTWKTRKRFQHKMEVNKWWSDRAVRLKRDNRLKESTRISSFATVFFSLHHRFFFFLLFFFVFCCEVRELHCHGQYHAQLAILAYAYVNTHPQQTSKEHRACAIKHVGSWFSYSFSVCFLLSPFICLVSCSCVHWRFILCIFFI